MDERMVDNEAQFGTLDLRERIEKILLTKGEIGRNTFFKRLFHFGPNVFKVGSTGVEDHGWRQEVIVATEKGTDPRKVNFVIVQLYLVNDTDPKLPRRGITSYGVGRAPGQLVFGKPEYPSRYYQGQSYEQYYLGAVGMPSAQLKVSLPEINGWLDKAFPGVKKAK